MTASTLVHGGWALLLSVHWDQDDVLFGSTDVRPAAGAAGGHRVRGHVRQHPAAARAYQPDVPALEWLAGVQRSWSSCADSSTRA